MAATSNPTNPSARSVISLITVPISYLQTQVCEPSTATFHLRQPSNDQNNPYSNQQNHTHNHAHPKSSPTRTAKESPIYTLSPLTTSLKALKYVNYNKISTSMPRKKCPINALPPLNALHNHDNRKPAELGKRAECKNSNTKQMEKHRLENENVEVKTPEK
ncbi:hypothetical protein BU16DRAFT_176009 [Lophium mytilinum]|uniref:Uncharacterized protein n=1 Tax=Lophium mytilinum TaxID=390894 RepID=A0A6A6QB56_9PEZI|nr:hypothetical protein BU16DRAFT_176009 [Lophium mytilinum]